jgi:hypothetical protein
MQAGERCSALACNIVKAIRPLHLHPVTARVAGYGIGLALEEHPLIAAACEDGFEADGVYSLRVGLSDGHDHAIVSAMVAVHARGHDLLWCTPGGAR